MALKAVKDLLVGAVVGIVSMLPGASGATIAVVFGIYERLINDLAHIRGRLLRDLRFIVPVGVGVVAGLFLCAFGLEELMDRWEVPMMFLFAALILTQIPDIRRMGDDGKLATRANTAAFACGVILMFAILALGLSGYGLDDNTGSAVVWVIAGIILAVSKIAPGISGSTILLALGLYTPFMSAMTDFDMSVLLPGLVGMLIGALAFAKVLDRFISSSKKSTYMAILGLTVGSVFTVAIEAATKIDGTEMVLQSIVGIVLGLVFGYALMKVSRRYAVESREGPSAGQEEE